MLKTHTRKDLSFQHYLESVVAYSAEFAEVKDVIGRFDALTATNTDLKDRERLVQETMDKERADFAHQTESKNAIILNYNNELAKLQARAEESRQLAQRSQLQWDRLVSTSTKKSLEIGQIKMYFHSVDSIELL